MSEMDLEHAVIDRRSLITRGLIWGAAGTAAAAAGSVVTASPAGAAKRSTAVFDVACLLNTFTFIAADGATDPFTNFRGSTFVVEGDLYPAGTIPSGPGFDPAGATPTGHWICRGWFVNRTGREGEADRPEPHVITQQEYLLQRMTGTDYFALDQLTSSGLEGDNHGRTATRSVVGGTGTFEGARGSVRQIVTGSNTTDGPNFRFEFSLAKGCPGCHISNSSAIAL